MLTTEQHNSAMNGWFWNPRNYSTRNGGRNDILRVLTSQFGSYDDVICPEVKKRIYELKKSDPDIETREGGLQSVNNILDPLVRGMENDAFPGLEPRLRKLSDSRNLRYAFGNARSAYARIKIPPGIEPNQDSEGYKTISIEKLANWYINYEDPIPEIHQSIIGRTVYGEWPARVFFALDVEIETKNRDQAVYLMKGYNQLFDQLEVAREVIEEELCKYGIAHSCTLTGRGYHFISQIRLDYGLIEEMVMDVELEKSVRRRIISKCIPENSEKAFEAVGRLQQYFFNKVRPKIQQRINERYHEEDRIRVQFMKKWNTAIVNPYNEVRFQQNEDDEAIIILDNLKSWRTCDGASLRALSSPYTKEYDLGGKIIIPVTQTQNAVPWGNINRNIIVRGDMSKAEEMFAYYIGYIPEASDGLWRLYMEYKGSILHGLHKTMEEGDNNTFAFDPDEYPEYLIKTLVVKEAFVSKLYEEGWLPGQGPWHPNAISKLLHSMHSLFWQDESYDLVRYYKGFVKTVLGQGKLYEGS